MFFNIINLRYSKSHCIEAVLNLNLHSEQVIIHFKPQKTIVLVKFSICPCLFRATFGK